MRHALWMTAAVGMVLAAGCGGGEEVEQDQPADQFKKDTEAAIKELNARLDEAKRQKQHLAEAAAARLESATEMAEEQVETLRDTLLPQLTRSAGEEVGRQKARINAALNELRGHVDEAESVVAENLSEARKFARDTDRRLAELRERLSNVREQAAAKGEDAKQRIDADAEMAEEAIQEAGSRLGDYREASKEAAAEIAENIKSLLDSASRKLDAMAESLTDSEGGSGRS